MTSQQRTISMESVGDEAANRVPSWASPPFDESEERTQSRRRSLECTSVEVNIINTEITQDHTNYIIKVSSGIRNWIIKRRYKDFYYLDKQLRKSFPMLQFPTLPPKRYLRSSNDPDIVDQRKEQLESYLSGIITIQQIWTKNDLVLFLNDESNLMTFIWNFERMRRLQDMLSMMKVDNESETEKLSSDLEKAQSQVRELQARLSQMEMIFLQQATGVGGHLPPSVVRSISGVSPNALSSQLASELKSEHKSLYDYDATSLDDVYYNDFSRDKRHENENGSALYVGGHLVETMDPDDLVKALHLAQDQEISIDIMKRRPKTPDEARTYAVSREIQEAIRICNELLPDNPEVAAMMTPRRSNLSEADLSRLSATSTKFSMSSSESFIDNFNLEDHSAAWVQELIRQVEKLISGLTPTFEEMKSRHDIFNYLRDLVSDTLGVQLFPIGSIISHTFLPDGDMDATAFVPKLSDDSWYVKLNEALCLSAFHGPSSSSSSSGVAPHNMSVSNVSFVSSEVKMIRSMINGVTVDISTNQLSSLHHEEMIERVDTFVGKNHLFKRSLLLLKAWFQYESPRFTHGGGSLCNSRDGKISTWTVIVMLIWTFNLKGHKIHFPLQSLAHFFRIFSSFDWANAALTINGPVDFSLNPLPLKADDDDDGVSSLFFKSALFDIVEKPNEISKFTHLNKQLVDVCSETGLGDQNDETPMSEIPPSSVLQSKTEHNGEEQVEEGPRYIAGILNIVDPFDPNKNLLESVNAIGSDSIVSAFQEGYRSYQQLCDECSRLLAFGQFSDQSVVDEIEKLTHSFFLNTKSHVLIDQRDNFEVRDNSNYDPYTTSSEDLKFSIGYGQIALGGKIEQDVLTKLITIILEKKGSMPVGEIGKNLQALLGCESLSKRLKEQYSGLKRAIENSNNHRIKMGVEHPFNPIVSLGDDEQYLPNEVSISGCSPLEFNHESFIFIPYTVQTKMQAQALKESQSQQSKVQKSFRRQPPQILDSASVTSQSFSTVSGLTENTDHHNQKKQGYGSYRGKGHPYTSSPNRNQHGNNFFRGGPQPIPIPPGVPLNPQGHPIYPIPMDLNFISMQHHGAPSGPPMYPYPGMPIYPPPPMGVPIPYPPHPYYHSSVSSSVSSSYGQSSPLSMSPISPSYLQTPMMPTEKSLYPPSPKNNDS